MEMLNGYGIELGMGGCGSATRFLPTPEDAHLQLASGVQFGSDPEKACAFFGAEAKPLITQSCSDSKSLDFAIEPV
ncbi:hypothetical protein [Streptomyces sp. NPDC102487]|uniref:hypothetical protein n=1 Tax=Streptomyces sp. NPDC102487 TaxID=3366182 RepID=UPI003812F2D7